MNTTELRLAATPLRKGEILRLHDAHGSRIEVLDGSVWITIDGDVRDIVLDVDQGFSVDRHGDTLVSALRDSQVVVLQPLRSGAHAPA